MSPADIGASIGTTLTVTLLVLLVVTWGNRRTRDGKRLNMNQKKGWLIAHILFVLIYFAGVIGPIFMIILTYVTNDPTLAAAAQTYAGNFDWFLIIPGAMGCLVTGIWLAVRTHWGFANYYWIITKTVGNIALILFGGIVIRKFIHKPLNELVQSGMNPLLSPLYLENRAILFSLLIGSICVVLAIVIISYLKPWGKRKQAK